MQRPFLVSSSEDEACDSDEVGADNDPSSVQQYLEESRRIRKEQDDAYAQSLAIDKLKVIDAIAEPGTHPATGSHVGGNLFEACNMNVSFL